MELYAEKIMMVFSLGFWRKGMLRKSCSRSMMDPQEEITVGILLHTKSSEKDTTSLPYLKMLMHMLGNFSSSKPQPEEKIKFLSPYILSSSNAPSSSRGWTLLVRSIQTHQIFINTYYQPLIISPNGGKQSL